MTYFGRFCRSCCSFSFVHGFCFQNTPVVILEGYRPGFYILRSNFSVSGDVAETGVPAGETVSVPRRISRSRRGSIERHLLCFQNTSIPILECYGILVDLKFRIQSFISCRSCINFCNRRALECRIIIPADKCIVFFFNVVCCWQFDGGTFFIGGRRSITRFPAVKIIGSILVRDS